MVIFHICFSRSRGGLELSIPKFAQTTQGLGLTTITIAPKNSLIDLKSKESNLTVRYTLLALTQAIYNRPSKVILIFHQSRDLKWSLLLKLLYPKIKILYVSHMMLGIKKKDFYHKWIYKSIDHILTFTETQRQNHLDYLPIQSQQISWAWHSVDSSRFYPPKSRLEAKKIINYLSSDFLIGCVGRFDPQKGQFLLAQASRLLKIQGFNFHIMMIGSDTEGEEGTLQKVKDYVTQNSLARYFTFFDSQANIQNFFQAFDLFIMPSDQETYGLVLVEAMLCGSLSMAFNKGGPIDILDHGRTGLLVPSSKDPQVLAKAIGAVLSGSVNYQKLSDTGSQWAHHISDPKRFADNLNQILQQI